jgi:hypothetical protein
MRAVLAAAALAILAAPQDGAVRTPERFAAIIAAGPLTPGPTSIEIGVDHWATDEMRLGVAQLFQEGAQAALLEVLKRAGVAGYIRMPNHERLQAGYVQEEMRPDGGRRILMLCVRYPGDWELTRDAGWTDHPFRLIALTFDARNRGTGMLFHTARVTFGKDGPNLVDDLSGQPTKILSLHRTR